MGNSRTMRIAAGVQRNSAQVLIQELRLSTRDRYFERAADPSSRAIGAPRRPGPERPRRSSIATTPSAAGQRGRRHTHAPREVAAAGASRVSTARADADDDNGARSKYLIGDSPDSRNSTSLAAPTIRSVADPLVHLNDRPRAPIELGFVPAWSKPHDRHAVRLQVELLDGDGAAPSRRRGDAPHSQPGVAGTGESARGQRKHAEERPGGMPPTRRRGIADAHLEPHGGSPGAPRWRPPITIVAASSRSRMSAATGRATGRRHRGVRRRPVRRTAPSPRRQTIPARRRPRATSRHRDVCHG